MVWHLHLFLDSISCLHTSCGQEVGNGRPDQHWCVQTHTLRHTHKPCTFPAKSTTYHFTTRTKYAINICNSLHTFWQADNIITSITTVPHMMQWMQSHWYRLHCKNHTGSTHVHKHKPYCYILKAEFFNAWSTYTVHRSSRSKKKHVTYLTHTLSLLYLGHFINEDVSKVVFFKSLQLQCPSCLQCGHNEAVLLERFNVRAHKVAIFKPAIYRSNGMYALVDTSSEHAQTTQSTPELLLYCSVCTCACPKWLRTHTHYHTESMPGGSLGVLHDHSGNRPRVASNVVQTIHLLLQLVYTGREQQWQ